MIILSPAKTFASDKFPDCLKVTQPEFLERSAELLEILQTFSPADFQSKMGVSEKIADLNFGRYQNFPSKFSLKGGQKQAIFSFHGDVYRGLGADDFSAKDLEFSQDHVRILSGFYGLLRPLDLMAEYRLEMGTKLKNPRGKNLYEFWGDSLTHYLNQNLKPGEPLINLASYEYSSVINFRKIEAPVIMPVFKDFKNGKYKIISFLAKKARGMMTRYVVKNRIEEVEGLKQFSEGGYVFSSEESTEKEWVFLRDRA